MSRRFALLACLIALFAAVLLPAVAARAYTTPVVEQRLATGVFASLGIDGGGVSGDRVVYADARNGNTDIYCYDLSTGVEQRVTTDPALQYNPAISGDTIVFEDRRDWGNASTVYSYNLATHAEERISLSPSAATVPSISGRNVVWQYWSESGENKYSVWLYNLDTKIQVRVSIPPLPANQLNPSISGSNVVWQDDRSGQWDICYCQLPSLWFLDLTADTAASATNPSVSGQYAVWLDSRNGPAPVEVYAWDLLYNAGAQRITNDAVTQGRPKASGTKVVWSDSSSGNPDIFCHDLACNWKWPLTLSGASQSAPFIDVDKVVWQDARSGTSEVYAGELATPHLTASIGPGVVAYNARAKATGSLTTFGSLRLANRAIRLEYSTDGEKWFTGPGGSTDAAGAFSLVSDALTSARYLRVDFTGDAQHSYLSAQSAAVLVRPRASLTKPVAPATMSRTKSYAVHGNLSPKHGPGSNVGTLRCYRMESGHWHLRKSFALTATAFGTISRYNATVKFPSAGKWRMRAYHSDASHAPTYSGWRAFTVK